VTGATPKAILATLLLVGLVAGTRVVVGPIVRVTLPARLEARSVDPIPVPPLAPESLAAAAAAHDPFRIARRAAALPYEPLRIGQAPVPAPPKPVLTLVGIVWDGGRDPTALVEGFPGADGPRAVRNGEVVNTLRVKSISRDRVVIGGLDTVWTLMVREPWH
jgi:hypothetical protein